MAEWDYKNAISGKEGALYLTMNGTTELVGYAKNIEATFNVRKSEVPVIGKRMIPHVPTGADGSGSMTLYYVTSKFTQMASNFIKNGGSMYFDLQIINQASNTSGIGKQTITLLDCLMDSTIISKLDSTTDDVLDFSIDFTFDDFNTMDTFI